MQNIEMWWKVTGEATTKPPALQYRVLGEAYEFGDEMVWEVFPLWSWMKLNEAQRRVNRLRATKTKE